MSAGDREAEAQAKKEDAAPQHYDSWAAGMLKKYWCMSFRAVELILAIVAMGLMVGTINAPHVLHADHKHITLVYSAYSSFIIICGVLIIARLLGENIGWRTSIGFSVVGAIMFIAAAGVIFYDWHRSYYTNIRPNKQLYDLLISSGVFAVLNAAVFIIHAFLAFTKDAEY